LAETLTAAGAFFAAGLAGFLAEADLLLTAGFFTGFFFAVAILRYPPSLLII
jgi:hypothetical protein